MTYYYNYNNGYALAATKIHHFGHTFNNAWSRFIVIITASGMYAEGRGAMIMYTAAAALKFKYARRIVGREQKERDEEKDEGAWRDERE